ncbi:MAG: hypothetical protein K8F30_03060, partial [Taibaiella sp.]|nr:hypothetical protein [Taibaiella sp.]
MAITRFIQKQVDALIYGLVGPFAMLYVFPQFFLGLERKLGIAFTASSIQDVIGTTLMWLGAFLALWCGLTLMIYRGGTISAFSSPKKVVVKGPYKIVRHPMMWAIHIVLIGEILVFSSPMLALWFLVWLRIAALYLCRYEEPKLVALFGNEYI